MIETEFENEATAAAVETPPEEKAEKPKRSRKPKEKPAAAEEVAVVEATPNGNGEQAAAAVADAPPGEARPIEPPRPQTRRPEQTQAAETIDIAVLKEMKLRDLY